MIFLWWLGGLGPLGIKAYTPKAPGTRGEPTQQEEAPQQGGEGPLSKRKGLKREGRHKVQRDKVKTAIGKQTQLYFQQPEDKDQTHKRKVCLYK